MKVDDSSEEVFPDEALSLSGVRQRVIVGRIRPRTKNLVAATGWAATLTRNMKMDYRYSGRLLPIEREFL